MALPDGGGAPGFRRLSDGGVGGPWPEPAELLDGTRAGLSECPDGWQRLPDGSCDPRLDAVCPPGAEALPGGRCTPTAERDCPAVEYAELPPEAMGAPVAHVRADADPRVADRSADRPDTTVQAGLARVGQRGYVLVARGVYRERIRIDAGEIAILGVCAARVTLENQQHSTPSITLVNVLGPDTDVTLQGMTISCIDGGFRAHFGAHLHARRMVVRDSSAVGAMAYESGTVLEVESSVIRAVGGNDRTAFANGLVATQQALLRARDTVVTGVAGAGAAVRDAASRIELRASVVRGTRTDAAGANGVGASVAMGASLSADATVIESNRVCGVLSRENTVETLVRRENLPAASSHAAPSDPCANGCN